MKRPPLRLVIGFTSVPGRARRELLECGHLVVQRTDAFGLTYARRRRCRHCAGLASADQATTLPPFQETGGVMPTYLHTLFAVLVPTQRSHFGRTIDRGSAIVCKLESWDEVAAGKRDTHEHPVPVDYEGGRFTAMSFSERLLHAAGRQATRYPTVARSAVLNAADFVKVGEYNLETKRFLADPAQREALRAWGVDADAIDVPMPGQGR